MYRFAVRAGAKHVYATDVSNMIDNARKMAEVNNMSHKITFIKTRVEEAKLPMVDIIVSEWIAFACSARSCWIVCFTQETNFLFQMDSCSRQNFAAYCRN